MTTRTRSKGTRRSATGPQPALGRINPRAAGIDVGSTHHYVALPPDDEGPRVRRFGCATPELESMAQWLRAHGVTTVALESTGVYWLPVAHVLEGYGLEVCLVDAHHARSVPGRKTDVADCQWLQELHAHGLLKAAFRPTPEMEPVRTLWRRRAELVERCTQSILEMHKALECMNVQLHKVISDVAGVTGMRIVRAIVAGERAPHVLAGFRHASCKNSIETIEAALTGHWREDHLFLLEQALNQYDFTRTQIEQCDRKTETLLRPLASRDRRDGGATSGKERGRGRRNAPDKKILDLHAELARMSGVDLTKIEAIDAPTAFTVISEQGVDMNRFPSVKHFCSHLGLCPGNKISGGKRLSGRTRKVQSRAAKALRVAAQSLERSDSALGAFYRRMKFKKGAAKAITAAAHKLAQRVYWMLRHGEDYVLQGAAEYEQQYHQQRLRQLRHQARKLGLDLINPHTGEILTALPVS
jgi:transposase